jgi:hypothetical protein
MIYSNSVRAEVKAENPTLPVTEIAKVIGARWKELPAEEKEKFTALAQVDRERYNKEMAVYKAQKAGGGDVEDEEEAAVGGDDDDAMET